jgi:glyoxylase-like metal-dependent hydrolase (beta-lactamase superfamily II)
VEKAGPGPILIPSAKLGEPSVCPAFLELDKHAAPELKIVCRVAEMRLSSPRGVETSARSKSMITEACNEVSRRQFLISSGAAIAAACLAPPRLFAQEGLVAMALKASATASVTVQTLRRNISVLTGPGGNIAVLTGPDGKLLIDAEIVTARSNVEKALASINADPIRQLINTHWHFDHTGGNDWVHQAGASILAHENTRKHLSVDTRVEGWVYTFPAAPAGAIPTTVFQNEHTVRANNSTLALKHYGPAHTDSDISVHFTEADVLHTGDTFWNRDYPFIDYSTGGSIDGQIRAAETNLAKVSATTIVIPGHGAVTTGKADLTLFRDVLAEAREKVSILKKQGRTLEEVVAAKPTARYDAEWAQSFQSPRSFLGWVYQGV